MKEVYMTGNTLTTNPITGTNAYAHGAYGTPQPGFWGNTGGIGAPTPFGVGTPAFQPQVLNPISQSNPFTPPMIPQPAFIGQPTTPWQAAFVPTPQVGLQGVLQTILQTTPPQVVNTILQTTPPQVLPYVLNALACQQACQQVLAQNPHAVLGIHPQPFPGYATTTQGPTGFGAIGGFGYNTIPFVAGYQPQTVGGFGYNPIPFVAGYQPQTVPQLMQQGALVGYTPGMQAWVPTTALQTGFGQVQPQQPWFATTYGTW